MSRSKQPKQSSPSLADAVPLDEVEAPVSYYDKSRCDGCVQEAQRVFLKDELTLTLCGHHSYVNEVALQEAGWVEFIPQKKSEETVDEPTSDTLELEA